MQGERIRFYGFGDFRVDTRRRVLFKDNEILPLSQRNFDLLLFLIENDGQVLAHDDILERVWEGTFVEQANLKNAISVIRKILGEGAHDSNFIRTVPRRGYSFVAPLTATPDDVVYEQTESEIVIEEVFETDDESPAVSPLLIEGNSKTSSKRSTPVLQVALLSLVVLSLAGYGIWQWKSNPSRVISAENIKVTKLTTKGTLNGAIVSPDGNYFIYATVEDDGASLWVQQIATGSATRLTRKMAASFWFYTFSPDSSYIFYTVTNHADTKENGLFKVPLFGGPAQRVGENTDSFTFSPDGKRIAFSRAVDGKIQYLTADPDLSNEKLVTEFTSEYRIWSISWTPDSRGLVFALRRIVGDKTVYFVKEFSEASGAEKTVVPEMEKQITSAGWLPDKSSLIICLREKNAEIRQLWQFDPSTGEIRRVTNDDNSYKGFTITKDGKSLVTITESVLASVWTANNKDYEFKQITPGLARIASISSTRDGRYIYAATNNGVEGISVVNADGSGPHQISAGNDGIWLTPRMASDGNSVDFVSIRNGRPQLFGVDLDGRNLGQLTQHKSDVFNGKVLSDNRTVIFQGIGYDNTTSIFKQTPDGDVSVICNDSVATWDVSPDEKFLAYITTDKQTGKSRVLVKAVDSGWLYKSLDIQPQWVLRWTRDGTALTYDSNEGDSSRLILQPLDGGTPKVIAKITGDKIFSSDWSFDGKRLVIVRGKQLNDAVLIKLAG